jgi:hypothetical protein
MLTARDRHTRPTQSLARGIAGEREPEQQQAEREQRRAAAPLEADRRAPICA